MNTGLSTMSTVGEQSLDRHNEKRFHLQTIWSKHHHQNGIP